MPNTEVQSALKALRLRFNEEFELVQGTRKPSRTCFLSNADFGPLFGHLYLSNWKNAQPSQA